MKKAQSVKLRAFRYSNFLITTEDQQQLMPYQLRYQ